jgi:aspartate aminotransferase-like enzyme
MGLELFVEDGYASKTLTAVCLPRGIDGSRLRKIIEDEYGILIAGGIDKMSNTIVRIGHLGRTAAKEYLVPTIDAMEEGINRLGGHIEKGIGVRTFLEVLDGKA